MIGEIIHLFSAENTKQDEKNLLHLWETDGKQHCNFISVEY